MIYFVQSDTTRLIKIGRTTQRIKIRLSTFQSQWHDKLTVLDTVNGLSHAEKYLHRKFKRLKTEFYNSREWFEPQDELIQFGYP